ncbi:unnamed protein product [Rotaria sordida]|uniref:Uncharacterized protein n=1 Tax=Rotaria sordida TaxID=392033 RepID=A0A815BBC3_9BILA|nr:unnamed protein product [Rotaria sordida]CAF1340460.1 unnamed protein product [Rotaria sordida]CAF1352956.1 unnamed protein product [Rotaria sordida]CAF3920718.1 unnamed protein product [Rotaria sordida]CAF3939279.1 unnamed protein product [Rotaria sordida]
MSHLQYFAYEGVGQRNKKKFKYSQAVRVGDRIECAGQGGWNTETGEFDESASIQIDQAFKNVQLNLIDAGGKGWEQVFRIVSYHIPLNDEAIEAMVRNLKKWCPNHDPIWTVLGVSKLGEDPMKVEIDVFAHVPN